MDWAVLHLSRPGDTVLDPMPGSGTALIEACLLGRVARGTDIDPLARLTSKAKATAVHLDALATTAAEVSRLLAEGRLHDRWRPALAGWERWFRPEVASDLARIRAAVFLAGSDPDITGLLWLRFSSLIVARTSVANARDLAHSRHHYREWEHDPRCIERFSARMSRARKMMAGYEDRLSANGSWFPDIAMIGGDARSLDMAGDEADLVLISPGSGSGGAGSASARPTCRSARGRPGLGTGTGYRAAGADRTGYGVGAGRSMFRGVDRHRR